MRWFRRPKSAAEISLEQLQAQAGGASTPSSAAAASAPPTSPDGQPFRMPVDDVFTITGRGTVVTGHVETGAVRTGQRVTLTSAGGTTRTVEVTGVEAFRQLLASAEAGQNVGLLLKGVSKTDVMRGDVLSQ